MDTTIAKLLLLDTISYLQEIGDMTVGIDHDTDKPFTVFEGWNGVHKLNAAIVLIAGNMTADQYKLYVPAINKAKESPYNAPKLIDLVIGGETYNVYEINDLRLGQEGFYPYDDKPYFRVPEIVAEVQEIAEEIMGDWGFSDEYSYCGECGKVIHTSPDSYGWTPDYIESWGDLIHVDCIHTEDVLEICQDTLKPVPTVIESRAIEEGLLEKIDVEYENGLHPGMNDSPEIIREVLNKAHIHVWFVAEPSQFYTTFYVLVQPEDVEQATKLLQETNAYQGYDNAAEMSKALRGEHSDHIKVTTRTITPEQFIAGDWGQDEEGGQA